MSWMDNRPWLLQRHRAVLKRIEALGLNIPRRDARAMIERRLSELGLKAVA